MVSMSGVAKGRSVARRKPDKRSRVDVTLVSGRPTRRVTRLPSRSTRSLLAVKGHSLAAATKSLGDCGHHNVSNDTLHGTPL